MGTNYLGKTPLRERKVLRPGRNFLLLVSAIKKTLIHNKNRPLAHKRLYASSMAFKTILALVPALAIAMALLSGQAFAEKRGVILDKIVDVIYPVEDLEHDPTARNLQISDLLVHDGANPARGQFPFAIANHACRTLDKGPSWAHSERV